MSGESSTNQILTTNFINIPDVVVRAGSMTSNFHQELLASYLPTLKGNEDFLNHSPRYYLFQCKSKKQHYSGIKDGKRRRVNPAGFYHPTHQNGVNFPNKSFYSGVTEIPLDTEFNVDALPYKRTLLNFNPFQFVRIKETFWRVATIADFGTPIGRWKIQGKRTNAAKTVPRTSDFYICIGILNPENNTKQPVLFGKPSNIFNLGFRIQGGNVVGFNITTQKTGVKRKH